MGSCQIVCVSSDPVRRNKNTKIQATTPQLGVKPAHLRTANTVRPVLALNQNNVCQKEQAVGVTIVPHRDIDLLSVKHIHLVAPSYGHTWHLREHITD